MSRFDFRDEFERQWKAKVAQTVTRFVAIALLVFAGGVALCCWKGGNGIPSPADVAAFDGQQSGCVAGAGAEGGPDRATVDRCRAESRARWCARFPSAQNCRDGREGGVTHGD